MTSSFPFTRRQALAGAAALLVVLALGGRLLASAGESADALPVEPVAIAETTERRSPEEVVVHVVGAVRRPGLYRLDDGSRVADALDRAGGATPKADLGAVNLAALLLDGTQIVVPRVGRGPGGAAPAVGAAGGAPAGPIRLNAATVEELQEIPGVGPVTAQQIVAFREENGPFRSVDELDAVPGIGPKRLEQMRELVVP